jgi:IclR family mhp operon transcriptional activator
MVGATMSAQGESARSSKEALMRGPLRTLWVLRALNVHNGATVAELAKVTGISRPALYRILETLREAGYVTVDLSRQRYCLTMLVRTLAQGFTDEDWVTQVARPVLTALQRKVLWPVDLGTFMDNAMWIRETTRPASPMTIDRAVVGVRVPMLGGATGRAYLAFCPEAERELILLNLRHSTAAGDVVAAVPARVEEILEQTKLQGYGQRFREWPTETGAIAVPIQMEERVVGCITLTFIASVLTPEEAARRHLADLRDAARQIAEGVREIETRPTKAAA